MSKSMNCDFGRYPQNDRVCKLTQNYEIPFSRLENNLNQQRICIQHYWTLSLKREYRHHQNQSQIEPHHFLQDSEEDSEERFEWTENFLRVAVN
jgi:hypothetical protein